MKPELTTNLDTETLRYWLALHRAPLIGSRRFARLLELFDTPNAVFQTDPDYLRTLGVPEKTVAWLRAPDWGSVESDLDWLSGGDRRHCLTRAHAAYPALLREIPDPPPLLFIHGHLEALTEPHLAMVGSRSPTPAGEKAARSFARDLSTRGYCIVSGLAIGIDAASHRGALDRQGPTLAVAGTGPDRVYPRQHQSLADEIMATGGAVITEYPPGTGPTAANFPRRNRIISGLSLGTLIVEAARRSGSLITARMALEQNRDVFAIPGSIYSPRSQGCNELIQQGAKLVQAPEEILEEYDLMAMNGGETRQVAASDTENSQNHLSLLLKHVAYEPTTVDTLVTATGLPANQVAAELLALELAGEIAAMPGGAYIRSR